METETLKSLTGQIVLARTRVPDLQSVRKLNCWGSELEDISIVRQMPCLEVCSVSVNDITSLQDFQFCPNLQELYVRNNKIENLAEICYLKKLEKLRIFWLADNPCQNRNNYRMTVLKNLPNLKKLDNVVVDEEELTLAKDEGEELLLPEEQTDTSQQHLSNVIENGRKGNTSGETGTHIKDDLPKDPVTLSWEETNKIKEQLGLKSLPIEKMDTPKFEQDSTTRKQNACILEAVLILINELDRDSLDILNTAIKNQLDSL